MSLLNSISMSISTIRIALCKCFRPLITFLFNTPLSWIRQCRRHGSYPHIVNSRDNTASHIADEKRIPLLSSRLSHDEMAITSSFNPVMKPPYTSAEKYCRLYMEIYKKHLRHRYIECCQDNLVSIIMTTTHGVECISSAINSVMFQKYKNWELIIIDSRADNDTEYIVKSFSDKRIKYYPVPDTGSIPSARNAGLARAGGEYICYQDAYSTIDPDFILILLNYLKEYSENDVVYCAQKCLNRANGTASEASIRFAPFDRAGIENSNYIDIKSILHRSAIIDNGTGFNESLEFLSDWDFILRNTGFKAAVSVPAILSTCLIDSKYSKEIDSSQYNHEMSLINQNIRIQPLEAVLDNVTVPGVKLMHSLAYNVPPAKNLKPVSIIIPSYESYSELHACIDSINAFTSKDRYELIIVDNASGPDVCNYLNRLEIDNVAKVLWNDANYGFTYAVNQGIAEARNDSDIVLLNNDAIVTKYWLDALQAVLHECPDTGLVVPRQVVLPGEKTLRMHQPYRDSTRECDINLSTHHNNLINPYYQELYGYKELSFAPFFCVYIPRDTFELIGFLDHEAAPHYYSDNLYCDLVRKVANKKIVYTPHSKVYHTVQRATQALERLDPVLYRDLFINNNWKNVSIARR